MHYPYTHHACPKFSSSLLGEQLPCQQPSQQPGTSNDVRMAGLLSRKYLVPARREKRWYHPTFWSLQWSSFAPAVDGSMLKRATLVNPEAIRASQAMRLVGRVRFAILPVAACDHCRLPRDSAEPMDGWWLCAKSCWPCLGIALSLRVLVPRLSLAAGAEEVSA